MSKGKKQTTTQNQTQSGTSLTNTGATINRTDTPDVPDWVLKPFQDMAGSVAGLGQIDPASLVPGANPLQQQAATAAAKLGGAPEVAARFGGQPYDPTTGVHAPLTAPPPGAVAPVAASASSVLASLGMPGSGSIGLGGGKPLGGMTTSPLAPASTPAPNDPGIFGNAESTVSDAIKRLGGINTGGLYDEATGGTRAVGAATAPQTSGVQASQFLKDYTDPWEDSVVKTTLSDFDANAGRTRAQQDLDLAGSGAFGGSGAALTKSETEGQLSRARAASEAGLRSAGFTQALGAASGDAGRFQNANDLNANLTAAQLDRKLSAARSMADIAGAYGGDQRATAGAEGELAGRLGSLAQAYGGEDRSNRTTASDLGIAADANRRAADENRRAERTTDANIVNSTDANQRANIGTQATLGDAFRDIASQQAQAPIMATDEIVSLLSKLGLDKFIGSKTMGDTSTIANTNSSGTSNGTSTTRQNKDPMETAAQIAQVAALFMSDRRLKRDATLLGRRADGLGLYLFRYLWSDVVHLGVMAQEALRVKPEAVVTHPSGFLMVDYGKI